MFNLGVICDASPCQDYVIHGTKSANFNFKKLKNSSVSKNISQTQESIQFFFCHKQSSKTSTSVNNSKKTPSINCTLHLRRRISMKYKRSKHPLHLLLATCCCCLPNHNVNRTRNRRLSSSGILLFSSLPTKIQWS